MNCWPVSSTDGDMAAPSVEVSAAVGWRSVADRAPDVADGQAGRERVVGLQDVLHVAGDPGAALDRGHHGLLPADGGAFVQHAAGCRAEYALVDERNTEPELAAGVQRGHPGAG